jgi:hypothetical protein
MHNLNGRLVGLIAGAATVAASIASAEAQSNTGLTWVVMILGIASVGAFVRGRRARTLSGGDV